MTQIFNKINFNYLKKDNLYFLIIFLSSILITVYYGYRGVYPIDSFLIFDGGYKVLNGIHPFKDYWSITGPLLDYIQSTLFFLFEVNWFSYVLHAALINCLLACISFYFFLILGITKNHSLLYSLCISILAYPATGTPFMDHHAVIFAVLSIIFLILAFIKNKKKFWFFSSLFLVFSFFSKQIPSAYLGIILILINIIYIFYIKERKKNNNKFYIFGGIAGLLIFVFLFILNKIPIQNFLIQYIYYPLTIGEERTTNIVFDIKNLLLQFKFVYLSLIPFAIASFFLLKKSRKNLENKLDILLITVVFSTFLIFIYTQLLTKNQVLIFFLIPFYLGISHYFISKYFNKKIIINSMIVILIFTTAKYHLRFNEHKKFMELNNADFNKAINAKILDDKFIGLQWISPSYINSPEVELKMLVEVKKLILSDKKNYIIISDYQILPAIVESKFYAPNKWFDKLSVPSKKNKYFKYYKDFFKLSLKKQNIANIYVVGDDKLVFFEFIFSNKNCVKSKKINEIAYKLEMKNCL